jgi:uncharacterized protein YqgC (DUF456 family)
MDTTNSPSTQNTTKSSDQIGSEIFGLVFGLILGPFSIAMVVKYTKDKETKTGIEKAAAQTGYTVFLIMSILFNILWVVCAFMLWDKLKK